jgi:hypothetical protein
MSMPRWRHGLPETACGGGSMLKNTENVRRVLPEWIRRYGIKTLADVGAGDLNWIAHVDLPCDYRAYDVEPRKPSVTRLDVILEDVPLVDAILCRHVLNHIGFEQVVVALARMRRSCAYLMATTKPGPAKPVPSSHFADYDLEVEPFNLGTPLDAVEDCRGNFAIWKV